MPREEEGHHRLLHKAPGRRRGASVLVATPFWEEEWMSPEPGPQGGEGAGISVLTYAPTRRVRCG